MDQDLAYPFQVLPVEEVFHLFHGISVRIQGREETEISLQPLSGSLFITNERVAWFNSAKSFETLSEAEKQQVEAIQKKHGQKQEKLDIVNLCGKSFMFRYKDLVSHGIQGQQLICFLGSEEEGMEMEGEEEQAAFIDLLEQKDNSDIVNIEKGEYQIQFDLSNLTKEDQEQLFEVLSEQATAEREEDNQGEDEYLDEMITADQIDADGNIIQKQHNDDDDDDEYEDEDSDEDEVNGKYL